MFGLPELSYSGFRRVLPLGDSPEGKPPEGVRQPPEAEAWVKLCPGLVFVFWVVEGS